MWKSTQKYDLGGGAVARYHISVRELGWRAITGVPTGCVDIKQPNVHSLGVHTALP